MTISIFFYMLLAIFKSSLIKYPVLLIAQWNVLLFYEFLSQTLASFHCQMYDYFRCLQLFLTATLVVQKLSFKQSHLFLLASVSLAIIVKSPKTYQKPTLVNSLPTFSSTFFFLKAGERVNETTASKLPPIWSLRSKLGCACG